MIYIYMICTELGHDIHIHDIYRIGTKVDFLKSQLSYKSAMPNHYQADSVHIIYMYIIYMYIYMCIYLSALSSIRIEERHDSYTRDMTHV